MSIEEFIFLVVFVIALLVMSLILFLVFEKRKNKGMVVRSLNMTLFLIRLPKEVEQGVSLEDKKNRIAVMEQFLASLTSLKEKGFFKNIFYGQPYVVLELAIPFVGSEICFYLADPKQYEAFLEKQIYGFYSKATVEKIEDYNIFNPEGFCAGGFFKLEKRNVLPLKTYKGLETDPL